MAATQPHCLGRPGSERTRARLSSSCGRPAPTGILFCDLRIRRVVETRRVSPDTVRIAVELETDDGSRFEPPHCCGEAGPPDTVFQFDILARDGTYSVLSLPVYRP